MAGIVRDAGKTIEDDLLACFFRDGNPLPSLPMPRRSSTDRHDPSRRYHDRVARQYDSIYDNPYWEFHDELTWRSVKPFLPRDANAACGDLGCGTGKWGLKLLKSGDHVTFVDNSGSMIEQTRAKTEAMGPRA